MDLSIAGAYSIEKSLAQVQQSIGISLLKDAMHLQESQVTQLLEDAQAAAPSFGHRLDVLV